MKTLSQILAETKSEYVVMNENTLGYLFGSENYPKMGVLAGSVIKGGHNWLNGPVSIGSLDVIRKATEEDFHSFRVSPKGYNLN